MTRFDPPPIWHSQRFWVLIVSALLILGLAGISKWSGVEISVEWIAAVLGAVSAAFLVSRGIR
jgi:uncharacterized membrane protein